MSLIMKLREEYKLLYNQRQRLTKDLTENEKNLLMNMSRSRGLNKNNLSGFFFFPSAYSDVLITPPYIWRTWFYHRFIHHQTDNQSSALPKWTFEKILNDFTERVNDGSFRLNPNYHTNHLLYLVRECIALYESLQVIALKENGSVIEINYDAMPVFASIEENIFINLYFTVVDNKISNHPPLVDSLPENMQKSIQIFYSNWKNMNTDQYIGEQYILTEQQKDFLGFDLMIYLDGPLLDDSLNLLSNEQKRAISLYLKQKPISSIELCERLVNHHGASDKKDAAGAYEILPYVEEYTFSSLWLWTD